MAMTSTSGEKNGNNSHNGRTSNVSLSAEQIKDLAELFDTVCNEFVF
jgi:hypothetical protein